MSNYLETGLIDKYVISKKNGKPLDPTAKYFVLRLDDGGEPNHVSACRKAVLAYANEIKDFLPKLSNDLIKKYK